ncbi:RcnB family protein [Rugamonas sp.]|uniref:RcnB family protein n=1 Tax=Rugamonas sp. TaxID=1926287 RepID=UPI0025CE1091|nr:RcnB family protein [Rugamonas sp.]
MNNKTIFSALLSACLMAGGGAAYAQNHDDHRDDHDNRGQSEHHDDHHDDRHDDHRDDHHDDRHDERRNDRYDYHQADYGHHEGPRGAGPRHDMHRGERLGPDYRGHQYVVDDWRGHRLSAPPRGQHWVQVGGDYVLVAVATGIIADILLNN